MTRLERIIDWTVMAVVAGALLTALAEAIRHQLA